MLVQPNNPTTFQRHLLLKDALKGVNREEDFESIVKYSSPPIDILKIAPQLSFTNIKVGIIGGGVAGLSSAYELRKLGFDITILEANPNRIGGRIYTHYFDKGHYSELGAMRIPVSHETTWHYIDLFNLKTNPFYASSENNLYYIRGERIRGLNIDEEMKRLVYPKFNLTEVEKQIPFSNIINIIYNNHIQRLPREARDELYQIKKYYSYPIYQYDDVSYRKTLSNIGFSEPMIQMLYSALGIDRNLYTYNFLELVKETYSVNFTNLYEIDNGLVNLPYAFLNSFNNSDPNLGKVAFRQGSHVLDIIYSNNKVNLNYAASGNLYTEQFDYVVCAIPFSKLRVVNIKPFFSNEKIQAIAEINYAPAQKTLLFCKERFWEKTVNGKIVLGGSAVTDLLINTSWYPSRIPITNDPRGVIMASYNLESDAVRMGSLDGDLGLFRSIRELEEEYGLPYGYLDSIVLDYKKINWNNEQYALGGFRWDDLEHNRLFSYAAAKPEFDHHIFFAGEHISQYHSWLQGALQSGMIAANQIAEISKQRHWK
ncbi:MAG: amine oxidase [Haloplasmataceae bacterium]|nr:amine oxidase [Haloplasmataceae bacterium]